METADTTVAITTVDYSPYLQQISAKQDTLCNYLLGISIFIGVACGLILFGKVFKSK